jgi:hypothetical protein
VRLDPDDLLYMVRHFKATIMQEMRDQVSAQQRADEATGPLADDAKRAMEFRKDLVKRQARMFERVVAALKVTMPKVPWPSKEWDLDG